MAEPTVTFDDYTFTNIQALSPHFGQILTRNQRLPGLDGGFDNFGKAYAPSEIGSPSITFKLASETAPTAMYSKIDAVLALKWRGVKRLKYTPEGAANERFTFARITDIQVALSPSDHSSSMVIISVVFSVTEPAWYELLSNAGVWGSSVWGAGDVYGGGTSRLPSAERTDYTITPTGSTWTYPRIWIDANQARNIANPQFEVLYNGESLGWIRWHGTVFINEVLEIDCRLKRVKLDGVDAYANLETRRGYWLRFPPAAFTLRVEMEQAGSGAVKATLGVSYWEAYG